MPKESFSKPAMFSVKRPSVKRSGEAILVFDDEDVAVFHSEDFAVMVAAHLNQVDCLWTYVGQDPDGNEVVSQVIKTTEPKDATD